jgi:hypothetical protein
MHELFARDRLRGEWFQLSPTIAGFVADLSTEENSNGRA